MIAVLAIACATALGVDNLLGNPGFEETVNQRPAAWDVYLQDTEVSLARADGTAQSGAWSAMIQNALPYDREPYNNWSQNIVRKLGGQRLRVAASVRTENVGGAALWVQCWQERPLRVLKVADTSEATPLSGTHDWQAVSLYFMPPPDTDFLTVRCLITGTGTAWFDDVSLEPVPDENPAPPPAAAEKPVAQIHSERMGRKAIEVPQLPVMPVAPLPPLPELRSPAEDAGFSTNANVLLQGAALQSAIEAMQKSNASMLEELNALREELRRLKADLPEEPPPPALVPHAEGE